jgi:hypothetical protein
VSVVARSSRQRQALVGWLDTIRRTAKGHGIRVSLLRTEAARKMSECRGAVPVWVMPLSRVVENFDPRTTRFDVVKHSLLRSRAGGRYGLARL